MGYLTANDRVGVHAGSWYAATAIGIVDRAALEGEHSADVCIVGGGYAGLTAALTLAERGYSVVLLEANRAGWGASGRNGGQVASMPRAPLDAYERAVGRDDTRKALEIAQAANRLVRDLVARHEIPCDLRNGGLEAAWRRSQTRELEAWPEQAARVWGIEDQAYVDADGVAELLGTRRYWGGVIDPRVAHLHPLNLALGIARAAEAAGAKIFERSRVARVGASRVETERGAVSAGHIVLACNGYIDGLVPEVARRSMPINNFVVASEPLDPETATRINRADLCVSDLKFVLNYYRLTPDRRLLWGGGESYGKRFPRDIEGVVRRAMVKVYPDFAGLRFTHAWGGTLGITPLRMPVFQTVGAATLAIHGWSGSGIHMGVMGGQIAAEAIMGRAERWDLLARLPTPPFPGGDWFRAPLLAAAMTWYSLRDRL